MILDLERSIGFVEFEFRICIGKSTDKMKSVRIPLKNKYNMNNSHQI